MSNDREMELIGLMIAAASGCVVGFFIGAML